MDSLGLSQSDEFYNKFDQLVKLRDSTKNFKDFNKKQGRKFRTILSTTSPEEFAELRKHVDGLHAFARTREDPLQNVTQTGNTYHIQHGKDHYVLYPHNKDEIKTWSLRLLSHPRKPEVGVIHLDSNKTVLQSKIHDDIKGSGLGRKMYAIVAKHEGGIKSDTGKTSQDAFNVYRSLAKNFIAKPLGTKNTAGNMRWKLEYPKIQRQHEKLALLRSRKSPAMSEAEEVSPQLNIRKQPGRLKLMRRALEILKSGPSSLALTSRAARIAYPKKDKYTPRSAVIPGIVKKIVDKSFDFSKPLNPKSRKKLEKALSASDPKTLETIRASHPDISLFSKERPIRNPLESVRPSKLGYEISHDGEDYELQSPEHTGVRAWELMHPRLGKVGEFFVQSPSDVERYMLPVSSVTMRSSKLDPLHAGTGLGQKIYAALAKHYGSLDSDVLTTSSAAKRVYRSLGRLGWVNPTHETNVDSEIRQRIKVPNITRAEKTLRSLKGQRS